MSHVLSKSNFFLQKNDDKKNKDNIFLIYDFESERKKTSRKNTKKPEKAIGKNDVEELCKANKDEFAAFLNRKRGDSKCALIVGNGVSIPFGSDNWSSMIKNLVDHLEPFYIEKRADVEKALSNSSYALSSFVKRTLAREENNEKFIDAVRYCIYRKYNEMMHDQRTLVKVIALAKKKYPSMPILTYNYDTFIEKQYHHETKKKLGFYCNDHEYSDFVKLATENVIHLHGYIDYESKASRGVVLADDDYCNSYLKQDSWTREVQLKVLKEYNCLFIGSSMSDLFQMSLIKEAREADEDEKWNCFALMALELDFKEKTRVIKYFLEKGIKLIVADSFDELPETLADLFDLKEKLTA